MKSAPRPWMHVPSKVLSLLTHHRTPVINAFNHTCYQLIYAAPLATSNRPPLRLLWCFIMLKPVNSGRLASSKMTSPRDQPFLHILNLVDLYLKLNHVRASVNELSCVRLISVSDLESRAWLTRNQWFEMLSWMLYSTGKGCERHGSASSAAGLPRKSRFRLLH